MVGKKFRKISKSGTISPQKAIVNDLPAELIDKIVSYNGGDMASLRASSCISKAWRAASLPYLFSFALFSSREDFARWRTIHASCPYFLDFVRIVKYEPGARTQDEELSRVAKSLSDIAHYGALVNAITNPPNYSPHPPGINISCMPRARKLLWDTLLSYGVSVTPETRQFISSFPAIQDLHFSGLFSSISDGIEFLSLFKNLQKLELDDLAFERGILPPPFQYSGDMSALRDFSIKDCRMPADWIVDKVFAVSPPKNLRRITCESGEFSFSPKAFARLLDLAADSLEKLAFTPSISAIAEPDWLRLPPFARQSFENLHSLTFVTIQLGSEPFDPAFTLQWCTTALEIIPLAPKLQRLVMHTLADEPDQVEEITRGGFFDWDHLAETVSRLYPELKEFVFRVSMEYNFGEEIKIALEKRLRKLLLGMGEKLVIDWYDENATNDDSASDSESDLY
ncbi:hypothetical protein EV421DRAFT_2014124 [Armillaria borealis]|uniref:F-box domain-containing protein n=1 Tax=Armillaria borealis TaxID=47425 RepID=A0AA39K790_9AGAR|nr:hypothetical protein EV421DRAFT_2014124 [Armillaria borealis]